MKRRVVALMLTTVLTMGMVVGCGGNSNGGKASDSKKLILWTNMEVEADTIQECADKWSEESGYDVEVIHESPDVQQFAQASNSASGPDAVIGIPNDQLADYVNAGLVAETPEDLYEDEDFSDDGIHPNEKGHEKIYKVINEKGKKYE